jgi:hypothetical protein
MPTDELSNNLPTTPLDSDYSVPIQSAELVIIRNEPLVNFEIFTGLSGGRCTNGHAMIGASGPTGGDCFGIHGISRGKPVVRIHWAYREGGSGCTVKTWSGKNCGAPMR